MSDIANTRGFSILELIVTVAILGTLTAITVPALMEALDRSRQSRAMADMRVVGNATATMFVDTGDWAGSLLELDTFGYLRDFPPNDPWGEQWHYHYGPKDNLGGYHLRSLGSDRANGPAAPDPWISAPYDPDIEITNGVFTKAPTGQ